MLGEKLKSLRKKENLSQEELAEKLNVTRQSISLWENNQSSPSIDNIIAISRIFSISIDELVDNQKSDEKEEKQPANKSNKRKIIIAGIAGLVIVVAVVVVFLLINRQPNVDGNTKPLSSEEIYNIAAQSTVEIQVTTDDGKVTGTGFCDDNNGTIITNYHVIKGGTSGFVKDYYGTKYDIDSVIGYDKELDIAILKTDFKCDSVLPKRDTALKVGEEVYALGSSQGLTDTFSSGIISAIDRDIDGRSYIQTTAPISSGNSGGPLIDKYGKVVGINSASISDGQNLNFVIDIKEVNNVRRDKNQSLSQLYNLYNPNRPYYEEINTFFGIQVGKYAGTVHLYSCELVTEYNEQYKKGNEEGYAVFVTLQDAVKSGYHRCDDCHCADEFWKLYDSRH